MLVEYIKYAVIRTYAQQILFLAQTIQVPSAEWQGSKVLIDDAEELARGRYSQRNIRSVYSLCVVRCLQLLIISRG